METVEQDSSLEVLNSGVLDFFTDEMIPSGMQIYRNTINWNLEKDTVFPDVPIMDHEHYRYDTTVLAPAAWHSPDPSIPQAFHYGVHRGIKSIQKIHSTTHWANMQKVWHHFLQTRDVRLGFAVLGAELVYAGTFNRKDQDLSLIHI